MAARGKTIFEKIIKNVSPYLTKSGIRRSGKSVLLQEFVAYLQSLEEPLNDDHCKNTS